MYGTVVRTEHLTPHLVRVVLGGDGLADFRDPEFADSYVNAFFLPPDAGYQPPFEDEATRDLPRDQRPYPRRYTIRSWDGERREMTIDFVVHGEVGYAGRWALHARPGDRLQLRGPAGDYSPPTDADGVLLVGDESALPAIAACVEHLGQGTPAQAVIEVEDAAGEVELSSPGDLDVRFVHRADAADEEALTRLLADAVRALPRLDGVVSAFVHGEAESIRAVGHALRDEARASREHVSISPYWRRGLTDEQWRAVKGDWVRGLQAELA
ncbi:siderophore-interacting protein [Serinicoccus kebangsaanensis]|uniref:siderophore-interacting protein n=1 Tax=Serinicoccus kebangsaanensis TaxID=2602069 RepID=UPI00124F05D7|nr:siderophore-interacting protein [Serinicoccus kebangsaanensis]